MKEYHIMNSQLIEAPRAGEIRQYRMFINREWAEARSGKTFESVNPYTGRPWAVVPEAGDEDVDDAVQAARAAFDEGHWGRMTGTERARLMRRLADLIAENTEQLATIESADNGKLLRETRGQLKALPEWFHYFAGAADKIQGETIPSDKPNFFIFLCAGYSTHKRFVLGGEECAAPFAYKTLVSLRILMAY
jgi:(Z)-2-((N-methylformamido)methylene)-5-hydroxybutyrolactone dehydrogenase